MYRCAFFNPIVWNKICYIFDQYMLDLLTIGQSIGDLEKLTYSRLIYWHKLYDVILKARKNA